MGVETWAARARSESRSRVPHSLPQAWDLLWGEPSPFLVRQLEDLRSRWSALALEIPSVQRHRELGEMVGSADLGRHPVHRWYHYKEAYSPRLPRIIYRDLGISETHVGDVFGGVATTALSLVWVKGLETITSIEYSPFAQFVGAVKLSWPHLEPKRLRRVAKELARYPIDRTLDPPSLAAFANPEIFEERTLAGLLSARAAIRDADLRPRERDFFMLGLASVIELASGAMKDGRALRILRNRKRTRGPLEAQTPFVPSGDPLRDLLRNQWEAMTDDIEELRPLRRRAEKMNAVHLLGDARDLGLVMRSPRRPAFEEASVGWTCFSPPYLNCIDYSEVYKLELWLLEFVRNQEEFRSLRLGTLRSHPSVEFPERGYLAGVSGKALELLDAMVAFVERHGLRPSEARMIRQYFDDMYRVFAQQLWVLKPGGVFTCVVANSTFSRRQKRGDTVTELWRLPVLTDVLLAHLAQLAGFEDVHLWVARDLRPRNVRAGSARESVIVGRKPK